ncbi:hypothetical protein PENTCL1PPCAC_19185, partial [Pristionchus entomophagus]
LDATLRLAEEIRLDSPLHPTRLVLQVLQANGFDERALLELLFDDDSGASAAFPMARRLFEWARQELRQLRNAARIWRPRHLVSGLWSEERDEEEEEEEEGEEESGSEASGDEEDEEMTEPEETSESREVDGPEPEERRDLEIEESSPFLIRVVQIMGRMEEERVFLLPAEEEPRRMVRTSRLDGPPNDAWLQLLQMSSRLSQTLQRHVKLRGSNLRKECRELIEIIERFLEATKEDRE